jgi:hypothetical protein
MKLKDYERFKKEKKMTIQLYYTNSYIICITTPRNCLQQLEVSRTIIDAIAYMA